MQDARAALEESADHHCRQHAVFMLACDECRRARAAFLPYRSSNPNPEPSSRSFQRTLGPAFVVNSTGIEEATAYGLAEGIAESLIDVLLKL